MSCLVTKQCIRNPIQHPWNNPNTEMKAIKGTEEDTQRNKCMRGGDLADLRCNTATTAMLSEWKQMCLPDHCGPHRPAAIATGTSSLTDISTSSHSWVQGTWNQPIVSAMVPQPQLPDVSE